MKYALLIYSTPDEKTDESPVNGGEFENWDAYNAALAAAGAFLAGEALDDVDTATTLRQRGSERLLTDGPFVETKEHLLGFFLIDVPDLDTALDWAGRMPLTLPRAIEVRPLRYRNR